MKKSKKQLSHNLHTESKVSVMGEDKAAGRRAIVPASLKYVGGARRPRTQYYPINEALKVAIILARKNSKRLRNKHLILVKNKPLIQYTFDYAKKSKCPDDILCSTDCPQIAHLAELSQIQVVKRPPSLANDQSPIIEAIEHALFRYTQEKGFLPGVTIILYGNVPYRSVSLEKGMRFFYKTKADAVFTARAVSKYHPDWMFRRTKNNQMIFDRNSTSYRCQDLLPYYCSTDSFIIAKTERLLKRPPRHHLYSDFGDRIFFIEEDENIPLLDIDNMYDLNLYHFFLSGKFSEPEIKYWRDKGGDRSFNPS